ncbi:MAG: alpha/beta hydrolase [Bacteroidetes bacterium]|nr:alpha/beta hydrolase [Fibrella sp.]
MTINRWIITTCFWGLVSVLSTTVSLAQSRSAANKPAPLVIGESLTLHSGILGEDRSILIYKPAGYAESTASYPVLYLLDGHAHLFHVGGLVNYMATLGRMPKLLIVGIANTDRGRDMTPKPQQGIDKDFPSGGGATEFLAFINQEVKPFINSHFRTEPYEIVAGTSLSGLFAVNTFLTQPALFNAYIAVSPALWWDKQAVPLLAQTALQKPIRKPTFFFVTLCPDDSPVLQQSTRRIHDLLARRTSDSLTWAYRFIPDETHNSVVHLGLYTALKALYKDWQPPQIDNLVSLETHYRRLSIHYGYPITVPEEQFNSLGYQLLFSGKADAAIAVFVRNTLRFPDSSNAHDSLGDAYKVAGKLSLAKGSYGKACKLGKEANSPNLSAYQNNLEQVNKLIAQRATDKK